MRIGFDITALAAVKTGVGVYTENLLKHMVQQTTDDTVIELTHCPPYRRRLNKTLWMQTVLPYELVRNPVDICHFTNNVAPLWTPCPTVLTIHDMTLWLYPEHHYRKRLLSMRPFIPLAARHAQAIIAVSQSVKADIVRILGVPPSKIHVIYSAPPDQVRRLAPDANADSTLRNIYGLPERFMLYVGTIEPRKNLTRLLQAFALMQKETTVPHCLVVVGARGWKDKHFFATIEQLGLQQSIRYLGYVPLEKLIRLYNMACVLAFPSLYEGCGLPVLEGMACGTPVVASRRGGLAEIAGDAAEFVEPTSVESIAHGLYCVTSNPYRQAELRDRGIEQAKRFSWQTTSAQTRQLYRYIVR